MDELILMRSKHKFLNLIGGVMQGTKFYFNRCLLKKKEEIKKIILLKLKNNLCEAQGIIFDQTGSVLSLILVHSYILLVSANLTEELA